MTDHIHGLFGLALAGGAARRLGGGDKPLMEVGDKPMLEHVLGVLAAEAEAVAISANGDPARFGRFALPVLDDGAFVGCGPLAGVLAGLEWAARGGGRTLLTIPGDTPLAPAGIAGQLGPPPACAASDGRTHYLVALWPVEVRDELRRLLSSRAARAAGAFAAAIGTRVVAFPSVGGDPFQNVNTPADLTAVRARFSTKRLPPISENHERSCLSVRRRIRPL